MSGILAVGALTDIGIGAGGALLLAVVALLVKRGISGDFQIGGNNISREDFAKSNQAIRDDGRRETKYNREVCDLKHQQIQQHLVATDINIGKLEAKVELGFEHVEEKLDKLTEHLMKNNPSIVKK